MNENSTKYGGLNKSKTMIQKNVLQKISCSIISLMHCFQSCVIFRQVYTFVKEHFRYEEVVIIYTGSQNKLKTSQFNELVMSFFLSLTLIQLLLLNVVSACFLTLRSALKNVTKLFIFVLQVTDITREDLKLRDRLHKISFK